MRRFASVDAVGAVLVTLVGLAPTSCGGPTSDTGSGGAGGIDAGTGRGGTAIGGAGSGGSAGGETGADARSDGDGNQGSSEAGGHEAGVEGGADIVGVGHFPCVSPEPVIVAGIDTGYDRCASGALRRRVIVACPTAGPRNTTCSPGPGDGGISGSLKPCAQDADCDEKPFGHCERGNSGWYGGCHCQYGCSIDADCPTGRICVCANGDGAPGGSAPVGTCAPATCLSDADCSGGFLCTSYETGEPDYPIHNLICPQLAFSCQSSADSCGGNADCGGDARMRCSSSLTKPPEPRVCRDYLAQCVLGRPFVIDGAARQSAVVARKDWVLADLAPDLEGMRPSIRHALATRWAEAGVMEHASVAAFARFALQLLAVGAPANLVVATQRAMADETEHAKMCFALASAYAGEPMGPGPLPIDGALSEARCEQVLALVVREGMVGETMAAVEAREALAHAVDPTVRGVLERIAEDETRHAELAWQFAAWAIEQIGERAREIVHAEIAAARRRADERALPRGTASVGKGGEVSEDAPHAIAGDAIGTDLRAHGWVDARTRALLERDTLSRIIEPCGRALTSSRIAPAGAVSLDPALPARR